MECPNCRTVNPTQARFCMGCGLLLVNGIVCSNCYIILPAQARYCYHCGTFQAHAGAPGGQPILPAAAPVTQWAQPGAAAQAPGALPHAAQVPIAAPQAAQPPGPAEQKPVEEPAAPAPALPGQQVDGTTYRLPTPAPRPIQELLPSLEHYLPAALYDPLSGVPNERELAAARDHMNALLKTLKTYLPWPVIRSPQSFGVPAGSMYRGAFLFGDVSGITPLSEKLKVLGQQGAEIMTALINALFTDLVKVLVEHGGTLLKFGGDAMLGLFPAETDDEMASGALRAAQAALAMQEVLKKEQFSKIEVLGETRSLLIKCGISAGPYFAAHIGTRPSNLDTNGTMAYVTTGTTVNLAEEAEGHANPGEVAMTRYVYDLLAGGAETEPVNKNPDENFVRLVQAPALEAGASRRLEVLEPPESDLLTQITYLVDRLNSLTPYLPDELVARIMSNPVDARISPENRPVTIMFANYKGLSKLIEKMGQSDPELITEHLNRYFSHMASIVERYEGTLARMDQYAVGDRLVIFFGAPRAHEDDSVRAAATALEMQQAVREHFSALRTATGVYRFEQRIGINTGVLFAGNAGAANLRQEYTLMGDDINMAARLMSNATWGDTFISKRTMEQVQAFFEVEDLGEIKVKGKEIRIPTFKLLSRRTQVGQTRGLAQGESPLTGRDQQLERFKEHSQTFLNSHRGQIITVIGDSGLGKSRLTRELKSWYFQQEASANTLWIEAQSLSFSENMNYWMAAEIMRGLLGLGPNANQDDLLYNLGQRAEQYLGNDAMDATPYLAYMMGLELGEEWSWVKTVAPKARQKQIFRTALQFFSAAAKERPIVIAMDDLHWADENSLALTEDLLQLTMRGSLMFILIFRPRSDKGCWRLRNKATTDYPHRYHEIRLAPLDAEASSGLLAKLLPGAEFEAAIHQEILTKAAGNPFYLEEVVRSLIESGAVYQEKAEADYMSDLVGSFSRRKPKVEKEKTQKWRVDPVKIGRIQVPGNLHAAIVARIDRLTEDSRQALQTASVIGRQFRLHLFRQLSQTQEELDGWISQLESGGLIRPADVGADPLYDFPDALVQEVAYESLMVQDRQQIHRRIGELLELHFTRLAEETGQDLEQVLWQNCETLATHFGRSDDIPRALKYLEMAAQKAREQYANQTAIEQYQRVGEFKGRQNDKPGQAAALYAAGVIAYEIGSYETAHSTLLLSSALQTEIGDHKNDAWIVLYLCMVDLKQANYVQSAERHQHALELARSRQDTFQEGIHLTNLGRVTMRLGQYDAAYEQFQHSLELKQKMNDLTGQGFSLYYQGLVRLYQGDFEAAESALQGAIQAWGQVDKNERLVCYYRYGVGLLHLYRGQFEQAVEHLEKSLELSKKLELRAEEIETLSALSLARLGQDKIESAASLSKEALDLLAEQKDVEEMQQVYLNHFRVLDAANDPQAIDFLKKAHQTMTERARRIPDEDNRQIYLSQVKVNQEIRQAMQEIERRSQKRKIELVHKA